MALVFTYGSWYTATVIGGDLAWANCPLRLSVLNTMLNIWSDSTAPLPALPFPMTRLAFTANRRISYSGISYRSRENYSPLTHTLTHTGSAMGGHYGLYDTIDLISSDWKGLKMVKNDCAASVWPTSKPLVRMRSAVRICPAAPH